MVQELFATKNQFIDKQGDFKSFVNNLMGDSFLFSKADDIWKAKRQACGHAFYKDKLVQMMESLKDLVGSTFEQWAEDITNSEKKEKVIDIAVEFVNIMARNMITIALGEDINEELFELNVRKSHKSSEFETRKVKLSFAIYECWE